MHQYKCYLCKKPNAMTREEYMQQVKCQDECMHQAKCYPCNNTSIMINDKYMQQIKCYSCNKSNVNKSTYNKPNVIHAINQEYIMHLDFYHLNHYLGLYVIFQGSFYQKLTVLPSTVVNHRWQNWQQLTTNGLSGVNYRCNLCNALIII